MKNVNDQHQESMSGSERFAIWITGKIGTMGFFYIIFIWTLSWLLWNAFAPQTLRFDPYPAFVLWLFLSNMIQIFLMPLLMIGQNIQGKHQELLAENDFEVNQHSAKSIAILLEKIEELNKKIDGLEKRVQE